MASPQISRHDQLVRRLLNLKSGYSTDVADTVMPVLNVVDPADPMHAHLRGESRISGVRAQPPVAANNSAVEAMAGAGHVWVVTQAIISTTVASTVTIILNTGQALSAQLGMNPTFRMDGRDLAQVALGNEVGAKGAGQMFREALAGVPGTGIQGSVNTPAGNSVTVPMNYVLYTRPDGVGVRLQFTDSTQNDGLTVWLQGYERLLEPSETF